MAKKTVKKKKTSKKKKIVKKITKPRVSTQKVTIEMQPVLVSNFVALQKVMINLASKLDDLGTKMEKLLNLFELSAKSLAKKDFKLAGESPEILKKLDTLAEQNKIIARGLTLMHEVTQAPPVIAPPAPIPTAPTPPSAPSAPSPKIEEYKKSTPFKPLKEK